MDADEMDADEMDGESGVALLLRSFETFNTGDLLSCVELLEPDFIANIAGAPEPQVGRAAWLQNAQVFREAFPDLRADIADIFGATDRVAVRLVFRGTQKGAFFGIPPTGRAVSFSSIELYRVSDGLIAEEWVSPDVTSLMAQLAG